MELPESNPVVVEGNIGSGKSSLTASMSTLSGVRVKVAHEPLPPEGTLVKFYKNPRKYAYALQLWFRYHRAVEFLKVWFTCLTGGGPSIALRTVHAIASTT